MTSILNSSLSLANASLALASLPTPEGAIDMSVLTGRTTGPVYDAGSIHLALRKAEAEKSKQLAEAGKRPDVQRDLQRYAKVLAKADSIEAVLDDPVARKVFLTANGLREQADFPGLAKKALTSDPTSPDGLAVKLASVNGSWLSTIRAYQLNTLGVAGLKTAAARAEVAANFVAEKRLDALDEQLPGLGSAVLFKDVAATFDTPVRILGSRLAREVVTTALLIPKQIAVQSIEAQTRAISQRLDVAKLKDPVFVNKLAQRYLLATNGLLGGVTA